MVTKLLKVKTAPTAESTAYDEPRSYTRKRCRENSTENAREGTYIVRRADFKPTEPK